MTIRAQTPEELGKAIKKHADEIEIVGDIEAKASRIHGTRKLLWVVAVGAISAIVFWLLSSGNTTLAGARPVMPGSPYRLASAVAFSILGPGPALAAVSIAIGGDGVDALSNLRKRYQLIERSGRHILIKKKALSG